jgi:hypothetical protein
MANYTLENITVGITEQTLSIAEVDKSMGKSLFVINKGTGNVTFKVYGSPTGVQASNYLSKTGVSVYSAAEEALHYIEIASLVVATNNNGYINLSDYIYDFFKITAQSTIADTTINYKLQQAYTNQ